MESEEKLYLNRFRRERRFHLGGLAAMVSRRHFTRSMLGVSASLLGLPRDLSAGKQEIGWILNKRAAGYWAENRPAAGGPHSIPTQLFPADNWWNLDISAAPVDTNSSLYCTPLVTTPLRENHGDNYGYPFCTVSGNYPKISFDHVKYGDESDLIPYPLPIPAITERGWTELGTGNISPAMNEPLVPGDDRHLIIVDVDNNLLYEIFLPYHNVTGSTQVVGGLSVLNGQWFCVSCCFWDMDTNNFRPDGWTSSDAAGLQVLPGCIQYDECAGVAAITHAHGICLNFGRDDALGPTYVWPATHAASSYSSDRPPFGARFRLKPGYNLSSFGPAAQLLGQSFKTYGLIFVDNSTSGDTIGTNDERWGAYTQGIRNEIYVLLSTLRLGVDFEVVELGYGAP